jgi:hypothetical protein
MHVNLPPELLLIIIFNPSPLPKKEKNLAAALVFIMRSIPGFEIRGRYS